MDLEDIKFYELKELVPVLKVSYRTLLDYVNKGRLKAVKIGGRWRVSPENLNAFLEGR
jgi:excisionase family DNA binding protein